MNWKHRQSQVTQEELKDFSYNYTHPIIYKFKILLSSEAVARRCFVKKVFLEISQNSQENTCVRVSFLIKLQTEACNFIKKETLTQVISCKFWEISKNTFYRTPPVAAVSSRILNFLRLNFRTCLRHFKQSGRYDMRYGLILYLWGSYDKSYLSCLVFSWYIMSKWIVYQPNHALSSFSHLVKTKGLYKILYSILSRNIIVNFVEWVGIKSLFIELGKYWQFFLFPSSFAVNPF